MVIPSVRARRRAPRWTSLLVAVTFSSVLGGARDAQAAPVDPEARALYQEGLQLYRTGDYDGAIVKLGASYRLVPAPGLLYDLAQAHRVKGDCAEALRLYREFLDRPANGAKDGAVDALARSHVTEMESCLAAAAPNPSSAPAPASTQVSAGAPPPVAGVAPSLSPPALLAGRPADANLLARRPLRPLRPARRRAALAVGLVAVGLVAATGYFAWRADRASDQVSRLFMPGQAWNTSGMNAEQTGQSSARFEIATAAAALLSGGVSLWLAVRN